MRTFRYVRDPVFLLGCAAYAINRWILKPHFASPFLHSYFNDLFLIPCALPPLLMLTSWLGLRDPHQNPRLREIVFHLAIWSVLFEWIGPRICSHAVGDVWDVVAYTAGAIVAAIWWSMPSAKCQVSTESDRRMQIVPLHEL